MSKQLAENAYRPLKPGEKYMPLMSANKTYREANFYSVTLGIFFSIIFTLALMFLALKLGLGISADVPVAIFGLGLAAVLKRPNALGENMIMMSIPYTASGIMVTGTFMMPAFFIMHLHVSYIDLMLTIILGGILGMFIAIIYRDYFINKMHGILPFPGSFGTVQVLVSGETGTAKIMILSGIVGFIYDFITGCAGWWNEVFTTRAFSLGDKIATNGKMVLQLDVSAAFLGIGYLTGLRYSAVIFAGSALGTLVLTPIAGMILGQHAAFHFTDIAPEILYGSYIKPIGIGALVTAGVISLFTMLGVIRSAMYDVFLELFKGHKQSEDTPRTERDLSMRTVGLGIIIILILTAFFIYFRIANHNLVITLVAIVILIVFTIAFSIIAALALAYTSIEPVSGMTIVMLIVGALAFGAVHVHGTVLAMLLLMIASIVCAMLGQAGYVIGLFKEGQLIGSTPRTLQIWGIISIIISGPLIVGSFILLEKAYGFVGPQALAAPQGNAMASLVTAFSTGSAPWTLYAIGAAVAIVVTIAGVPVLPFAMGLYLPGSLATPFLIGGLISWFVSTRSKDKRLNEARKQRGIVIGSGLIAGGALAGIATAVIAILNIHLQNEAWLNTNASQIAGLGALICLVAFVIWYTMRAKAPVREKKNNKPKQKVTKAQIAKKFGIDIDSMEIQD